MNPTIDLLASRRRKLDFEEVYDVYREPPVKAQKIVQRPDKQVRLCCLAHIELNRTFQIFMQVLVSMFVTCFVTHWLYRRCLRILVTSPLSVYHTRFIAFTSHFVLLRTVPTF